MITNSWFVVWVLTMLWLGFFIWQANYWYRRYHKLYKEVNVYNENVKKKLKEVCDDVNYMTELNRMPETLSAKTIYKN